MKKCSTCGETKDFPSFYRATDKKDGHSSQCKACRKVYFQSDSGKEAHKRANRRYQRTEKGRAASNRNCAEFRKTAAFKRSIDKYRANNPERRAAQTALYNAMKSGRIHRPSSCSVCGITCKPEGHHFDYSKQLDVIWVCKACHVAYHWSKT